MHAHVSPHEPAESDSGLTQVLGKLLDALPKQYRTALILRDIEELDYEDIGTVFQCSVQAARLKVFRARLQMRRALKKLLNQPPVTRPGVERAGHERKGIYAL